MGGDLSVWPAYPEAQLGASALEAFEVRVT
jgi:hypothetical protein